MLTCRLLIMTRTRLFRRTNVRKYQKGEGEILALAVVAWVVASWLTHVVVCLKTASWGFLIAGAIMFPVAVIHGTGVWFGAF